MAGRRRLTASERQEVADRRRAQHPNLMVRIEVDEWTDAAGAQSFGRYISPKLKSHRLSFGKNDHAPRPQGEKRPAAVIGNAIHVMRIATG